MTQDQAQQVGDAAETPAATSEKSPYLDWKEGENIVYLTGIGWQKVTQDVKRGFIKLTFAAEPTSVSFEAPFTVHKLYTALPTDAQGTKIMMDRKLKQILYPLAEMDPTKPTKLSELLREVKRRLDVADFKCAVHVKLKEGKTVNSRTGEPNVFAEIVGFEPIEGLQKGEYHGVDYDLVDDDLLF